MSSPRKLFMILSITLSTASIWAVLDVRPVNHGCSGKIDPLNNYQPLVDQVSDDLIALTPIQNFNYYNEREEGKSASYGHGLCTRGISGEECRTCLHVANVLRIQGCGFVYESQVTLMNCHMRISKYDFKWDTAEPII
ncbi:hypothetical protein MLD38_029735 [Melastoma candidum]|uniref:Uncharacterized protein n=1 Tax=Melastoma candidum TaxID=119954 RepID=A0ACB9N6E6_9MYRT|nr:hypothetical protein MLD38_029735 [Melastoma candidum]